MLNFYQPNQRPEKSKVQSSDPDSEEESFSDVFKLKKSKKQNNSDSSSASKETFSQVNWKRLQSQLRKVDVASTTSEDKSDEDDGEISDEIYEKIVQCPLCTKKIQENTNSWKVNHLKQCAVKHKVSTHQLLKALKLQIKQMEEREALGLPPIRTERQPTSKRNTGNSLMKQMTSKDPSIQLAMALSASLQEAQEAALIEETSNLFEAGLESEAMECCKTLQTLPMLQPGPSTSNKVKKSKSTTVPVLLTRSKEDRERLIAEKVEKLVFLQEEFPLPPLPAEPYRLKSKTLKQCAVTDVRGWDLHQMENCNDELHYTSTYLKYGNPEKITTSTSSSTCRELSSEKQYTEVELNILEELETLFSSMKTKNKPESYVKSCITSSSSTETLMKMKETRKGIVNQSHNEMIHMKELKTLSKNLGAMVGKQALSDIVIYTKQETAIPCHKIILLSRIPTMLKEIIKEDSKHGGTTEMLMWNLDKKLCLLLLKYLYSGIIDFVVVNNLDESERDELKQFCDTYQVQALCKVIETIEARRTGEASSDDKSEHFDDMSENRNPEDTVKPKLSKWLDDLKSRDPSMWKKNFRLRFNKVDNKLKLDDFKAATNKTLQIDTDSNSDDVKNMDDKSTSTDTKSVQTKSTELNQHERQNADEEVNEKINETISVLSDDGASTVSSEIYCTWKPQKPVEKEKDSPKEPESMATSMAVSSKQDKVVDKPSVYHYDSDIYDQETIASSKTSDTELVVNSETEVRHSLRSVNSIYDKNTLPYNASQTKTKEQTTTPNKGNYSSQTVASPELFSDSDSDEDNNRNVLNVPSIKANTQQNLHQLMNMMEKDIEPTCPENKTFDEMKKRKRRLSPSPLDNLKRSKHTSVEHKSSSSSSDLPRLKQVNKVNTLYVNKELDSATNLMKKNNLSVPCVAGKDAMKSRPTARNLAIDFDKIEVDTSQPNKTLNLTVENLKLFDEINETSQHQDNSFFEKETLIVRDKNGAKHQGSDKSSLASSLFFESCMNRNKKSVSKLNSKEDICTVKRSDSGQEKTKIHPTKIDSLHLKRKKVPTPDFLKVKFDQGKIVEIKSSSTDDSDCYPTKALSQSYKFSQKLKKHTPTKPRNTLYHSQPQKKSTTHKPSRSLSQPRKNTNLFDTDSSDEFTEITKRKPKQTQDISFGILSPIPRLNERDTSIHKESETRERQGSRPDFQPSPVGDTNKYSPRKSNEIRSMALDDSRDLNQSNRQKSIFSPVIAEKTAGKTNDPYISYGSNKSSHKKSIFSPVIPGARDGKLCRDENDIASLRFNSDSSEHSGSSPSEPEIISNTRNVSKTKKSPEFSSRLSLSPRDSDIALSRRKYNKSDSPPQTNNRNIGDQSRSNENLSCSIPVLSPARDFWEYPDPVHDDIVVTSPTKPPSDPSPKFFSPPRYVWDDPAYQDNCMFPNEDPYMVDPPTSQYEHNLESRRLSNVDEQASPPKTMKYNESHSRTDSSSDTNPKHGIGLFEQKLLRLSQPLQNSQFMKKCSEYFKDKELKLGDQSGNQYSAVEKSSVLSKPSKSIVAPQHMHLSPEVIINKPEGLLDDSSSESLWKLRTKHYEHSKNRADGLDKEDTDHSDGYFISSKLSSDKTNRTSSKENATNSIEKDRLKTIKQKYAISSSDSENGKTFKLNKTGNTSKETFGKIKESKSKKHTNISSCDSDNDYLTLDVQTFRGQPDSFGSKDNSADSHTTATDSKKKNNLDRIGLERTKKYADMSSSDSESTWELISKSKPNSTKQPVSSSIHTYSTGTSTNSNSLINKSIQKSSPQTMLQRRSNSQLYRSNSSRGISKTIPSSPALQHTASYSQPNISSSNLYRSNTLRNLPESPTSSPRLQPTTSSYGQSTNSQPNTLSSPLYRSNSLKKSSKTSLSSPTVEPRTSYCQPSTSFSRNSLASNEKQSTGSVQKSLNFDQLLNESLNLTESYLNRLEMQQGSRTVKTPTALPKRTSMGFATDNNSTVTPLADYSTMETPLLKKELNKFGLKPTLGKSKAKLLLRHIYNQTHPYVDSSDDESRTKPSKRRKTDPKVPTDRLRQVSTGSSSLTRDDNNGPSVARLQKKKSPEKQKNTRRVQVNERAVALDKAECNSSDAGESESETSNSSQAESWVFEESVLFEHKISSQQSDDFTPCQVTSQSLFLLELDKILMSEENYRKILRYEPIWLEHLHGELKQRGVRSNLKQLMDYLDEKCITFRTVRQKPRQKQTVKPTRRKKATQNQN